MQNGRLIYEIPHVLEDVLRHPRVGSYVKNIDVGALLVFSGNILVESDDDDNDAHNFPYDDAPEKQKLRLDLFHQAAIRSEFVTPPGSRYESRNFINDAKIEEFLFELLLPLLPHLTSLPIDGQAKILIHRVVRRSPTAISPVMSNLRTVDIRCPIEDLRIFSALPSLRSLTAPGVWNEQRSDPPPAEMSRVTDLVLKDSQAHCESVHEYLLTFGGLETFTFSLAQGHFRGYDIHEPSLIADALLAHASTTLQRLTLLAIGTMASFVGSLREFRVLREFCTNWDLLFHDSDDLMSFPHRMPSRFFPTSLLRFRMQEGYGRSIRCYEGLIADIVAAKALELPHMEEIDLGGARILGPLREREGRLKQECEHVGISLNL